MEKYNCAETFPDDGEELSLLDILIVLAEQKKLIVAITLLFAVAGFGYTAFMKKDPAPVYKSEVQMVAEELRYVMGDGELSLYRPADMIKAVVASRSMRDAVLEEFPTDNKNDITIAVNVNSDKLITISVTSPSAELSMKASDFIYRKADAMLLALCAPAGGEKFQILNATAKPNAGRKGAATLLTLPISRFLRCWSTTCYRAEITEASAEDRTCFSWSLLLLYRTSQCRSLANAAR